MKKTEYKTAFHELSGKYCAIIARNWVNMTWLVRFEGEEEYHTVPNSELSRFVY